LRRGGTLLFESGLDFGSGFDSGLGANNVGLGDVGLMAIPEGIMGLIVRIEGIRRMLGLPLRSVVISLLLVFRVLLDERLASVLGLGVGLQELERLNAKGFRLGLRRWGWRGSLRLAGLRKSFGHLIELLDDLG